MEGCKDGRMKGWKDGKMEGWKDGRMEGWKDGRMEGWREGWKDGRMEGWKDGLGNLSTHLRDDLPRIGAHPPTLASSLHGVPMGPPWPTVCGRPLLLLLLLLMASICACPESA